MRLFISSLCIFIASLSIAKTDRKIAIYKNPDCEIYNSCNMGINIIYAKAYSEKDVLHYIYSGGDFTNTISVLILRSGLLNSTVSINYTNLISGSRDSVVKISDKSANAFGLVFTKLYEYNDIKDTVKMESDQWITRRFDEIKWDVTVGKSNITFKSTGLTNRTDNLLNNGSIMIQFNVNGKVEHAANMPHLQYTANNTQMDVSLDNLDVSYSSSRFAVEVALINQMNIGPMKIDEQQSLDDEHSPGVFRIVNFHAQNDAVKELHEKAYLQWKPVCYLSPTDNSLNQLSVAYYRTIESFDKSLDINSTMKSSLACMWFGDWILGPTSTARIVNVTFGLHGDKFYASNHYLKWTLSFGVGLPPVDQVSIAVILIISFGLGLPFILVAVGSVYLVIKKRMNRRLSYETIEDPIN